MLARDPSKLDRTEAKQLATWDLLKAESNAGVAELQWRLSLVLMVPILAFLAVPLARVNPREGRFARIAPAFSFVFSISCCYPREINVESGSLDPAPGLFWVHAGFAMLALLFTEAASNSSIGHGSSPRRANDADRSKVDWDLRFRVYRARGARPDRVACCFHVARPDW